MRRHDPGGGQKEPAADVECVAALAKARKIENPGGSNPMSGATPSNVSNSIARNFMDIFGDSPAVVAYQLLRGIAASEGKLDVGGVVVADRQWLLDTYCECLAAVTDPKTRHPVKPGGPPLPVLTHRNG